MRSHLFCRRQRSFGRARCNNVLTVPTGIANMGLLLHVEEHDDLRLLRGQSCADHCGVAQGFGVGGNTPPAVQSGLRLARGLTDAEQPCVRETLPSGFSKGVSSASSS
jgi:hypothetical protein